MSKQQPDLFALLGRPTITPQAQKGTWNYTPPARGESSGQEYIEFAKILGVGADALLRASIGKLRKQKSKAEEIGGAVAIEKMKQGYGNLSRAMRNYANEEGVAHGDNPFVPKEFLKNGGRLTAYSPNFRNFMQDGIQDIINEAAKGGFTPQEFDYELDKDIAEKLDEFSKNLPPNENARRYGFDPAAIAVIQKLRTGWASQFKARLSNLAVERTADIVTLALTDAEVSNKAVVDAYFSGPTKATRGTHVFRQIDNALVNTANHPPDDDKAAFMRLYEGYVFNKLVGDPQSPDLVENITNALLDVQDMAAVRGEGSNARMDEGAQSAAFANLRGKLVGMLATAEGNQRVATRASQAVKDAYWDDLSFTFMDQVLEKMGKGPNAFADDPALYTSTLMSMVENGELKDPVTGEVVQWRPKEEGEGGNFIDQGSFNPFRDPVYSDNIADVELTSENDFSPPRAVYEDMDKSRIFAAVRKSLADINTNQSRRKQQRAEDIKLDAANFDVATDALVKELLFTIESRFDTKGSKLTKKEVSDSIKKMAERYLKATEDFDQPHDFLKFREEIFGSLAGDFPEFLQDDDDEGIEKRGEILDVVMGDDLGMLVRMSQFQRAKYFNKLKFTKAEADEASDILEKAGVAYFKNRKVDISDARLDSTFNNAKAALLTKEVGLAPYFAAAQDAVGQVGGLGGAGLKVSVGQILLVQHVKRWLDHNYIPEYDKLAKHYDYDMKKVTPAMHKHFTNLDPNKQGMTEADGTVIFETSLGVALLNAPKDGALGINPDTKENFTSWLEFAQYHDNNVKLGK